MADDIEASVARALSALVGVDARMEMPSDHPGQLIVVEMTSGERGLMKPVYLDVSCWAGEGAADRQAAESLARAVSDALPSLDNTLGIFRAQVVDTSRLRDPSTRRMRYILQVELTMVE